MALFPGADDVVNVSPNNNKGDWMEGSKHLLSINTKDLITLISPPWRLLAGLVPGLLVPLLPLERHPVLLQGQAEITRRY